MQMHDRAGVVALLVHHAMQKTLLGRRVAADQFPRIVELR
jgi:hypothetical protein